MCRCMLSVCKRVCKRVCMRGSLTQIRARTCTRTRTRTSAERLMRKAEKVQSELAAALQATSSLSAISKSVVRTCAYVSVFRWCVCARACACSCVRAMTTTRASPNARACGCAGVRRSLIILLVNSNDQDPAKLADIAKGIYSGVVACLATAMYEGAAKIGIGVNMGNMLSNAADKVVKPFIERLIIRSSGTSPAMQEYVMDPHTQKWIDFGVSSVCSSVGIAVAYYADSIIYTVSNAMIGSEIMLHQVALLLDAHGIAGAQGSSVMVGAQWAVAGSGIFRQLVVGQSELPGPLKVVLFPAIMCESTLKALAGGLRATQGGLVA